MALLDVLGMIRSPSRCSRVRLRLPSRPLSCSAIASVVTRRSGRPAVSRSRLRQYNPWSLSAALKAPPSTVSDTIGEGRTGEPEVEPRQPTKQREHRANRREHERASVGGRQKDACGEVDEMLGLVGAAWSRREELLRQLRVELVA